jgi:hypothetical protein
MLETSVRVLKLPGVIPGDQIQFNFDANRSEEGYNQWRELRWQAMRQLGRKMGLPLERHVEVSLRGEIRLTGTCGCTTTSSLFPTTQTHGSS